MYAMNKLMLLFALLLVVFGVHAHSPRHLLLGGSGWNKIVIVDKDTKEIVWEHPLKEGWECNSVAATQTGEILFSYSKGAKMITRDGQELWNIAAPAGCEMQTARILPDGNALIAWCGHPSTILEVNMKGEILSKTEFETGIEHPHSQFRQVNKNEKGNYLVPLFATSEVREIAPDGKLLNSVTLSGTPFSTASLDNGDYLVSCGDAHCFVQLDFNSGKIVRQVNANGIEGVQLFFVAQLYPLPNGGLYICNWQGHDRKAAQDKHPQLIETNAEGKVVWQLNDPIRFGMVSTICPISAVSPIQE